ncbi:hypothetical protein PV08_08032 [Exophiala spinifera]|uniref:Heterokaryon incompatibility domain-containing protein n=1 Tax=Exophiala spinifera TaxID=91928 RepID=A0A0D2B2K6_9EURO|nr:uncharacterized protein PV08_08032 [Exophiala spinifera]KIW12845.1 hypothetical protein PV08_08032 [Exophiala spinifera]
MQTDAGAATLSKPRGAMPLCPNCTKLPLDALRPRQLTPHGRPYASLENAFKEAEDACFRIGTLKEIEARSDRCSLCGLLWKAVVSWHPADPAHTHCKVYVSAVGTAYGYERYNGVGGTNTIRRAVQISRMRVTFQGSAKTRRSESSEAAQDFDFELHAGAEVVSPKRDSSILARYRPQSCDMALIRSWLTQCCQEHQSICDKPRLLSSVTISMKQGEPYQIRFIDVQRRCLVSAPSSELYCYRYVALSYVWGTNKQPLGLHRENSKALHQDGGIRNASRTVEDAMKVTRELGYRFLWCDVLCVTQDDASQKAADISHMYQIYTRADLTIIAAGEGTADQGLPGISYERTIQRSAQIQPDLWLYTATRQPLVTRSGIALSCPWSTRGWTLQEQVLSLRCLFFLEDQVIWRCQSCDRFEDLALERTSEEPLHLRLEWARTQPEGQTRKAHHSKPQHAANIFHIENPFMFEQNFAALAKAYATRTLSFNSDIENAFQGIMTGLAKDFHKGIPVKRFEEYLCWSRHDPRKQLLCRRNDCPVPSWSWMAWKGPISFTEVASTTFPAIVCYRRVAQQTDDPAHLITVQLHTVTQKRFSDLSGSGCHEDSDVRSYLTNGADREWRKLRDDPRLTLSISDIKDVEINLNHLLFYADVADRVEVRLVSSRQAGRHTWMESYEILDADNPRHPLLKFKELAGENSTFGTAESSGAADLATIQKPENERKDHSLFAVANLFRTTYNYSGGSESREYARDRVCVMRVSWHGRVARREGVHMINSKQWDPLPKRRELIILG